MKTTRLERFNFEAPDGLSIFNRTAVYEKIVRLGETRLYAVKPAETCRRWNVLHETGLGLVYGMPTLRACVELVELVEPFFLDAPRTLDGQNGARAELYRRLQNAGPGVYQALIRGDVEKLREALNNANGETFKQ